MSRGLVAAGLDSLLPSSISWDETIQNLSHTNESLLLDTESEIENTKIYSRIDELSEEVINYLGRQFKVDFWNSFAALDIKRNLVKGSIAWHRKKGTKWAIRKVITDSISNPYEIHTYHDGTIPYLGHWATFAIVLTLDGTESFGWLKNTKAGVYITKPERSWVYFIHRLLLDIDVPIEVCANSVWKKDICIWYPFDETLLDGTWCLGNGEEKLLESNVVLFVCKVITVSEAELEYEVENTGQSIKLVAGPELDGTWELGWMEWD